MNFKSLYRGPTSKRCCRTISTLDVALVDEVFASSVCMSEDEDDGELFLGVCCIPRSVPLMFVNEIHEEYFSFEVRELTMSKSKF